MAPTSTILSALAVAFVALFLLECGSGEVIWTGDGDTDVDSDADSDPGECPGGCPTGQLCVGGTCVAEDEDLDGDGFPASTDCNDNDSTIFPGQEEVCNGEDDDCDSDIDEGFDTDRDGYSSCREDLPGGGDCNDSDPGVHPNATELCNGIDEDCNGVEDDGIEDRTCTTSCGDGVERCLDGAWQCDAPGTCECDPVGAEEIDDCGLCGTRTRTCQSDNTWGDWGDCEGEGVCREGATETRDCERCGVETRTCNSSCRWTSWGDCTGMRACEPGDRDDSGCDGCSEQVCASDCRWGPCTLKPTSACEWRAGTSFRCCGTAMWQYCLSSCQWSTDCAPCSCSGSCPSCC